jgi:3-oxoacyl-[acyl-carrier protein] reductase
MRPFGAVWPRPIREGRVLVPGLLAYAATKGAVKIFTQALSRELGSRGITVNNVQPGPIDTDLNPASGDWAVPQKAATALDRYGHVDDIAAMVAFVAGPEASYNVWWAGLPQ